MNRLKKLRVALQAAQLDGLFITNKINRLYLCGFTGSNGLLYVTLNKACLIVDGRYSEQAAQQTQGLEIYTIGVNQVENDLLLSVLKDEERIGFEADSISFQQYKNIFNIVKFKGIDLMETHLLVEKLRMIKSSDEVARLRRASQLTQETFNHILGFIKEGMTEQEVAFELEYDGRRRGASGVSFDSIVASGTRTALPHGHASTKKIVRNELIMIDFGLVVNGYYADITRTFAFGKVDDHCRQVYQEVLEAQQQAIRAITVGKPLKSIDATARAVLHKVGLDGYFTHRLGHSIGLMCHEYPSVDVQADELIQKGMTFTVEPGVYLKGNFGVRIEDDVYVSEKGEPEILTPISKEWLEL